MFRIDAVSLSEVVFADLNKYLVWLKEACFINHTNQCTRVLNQNSTFLLDLLYAC